MLGAIKYNLTHLLDFGGRDARQTFWFYVLSVFLLNMAIGLAVVIPFMGQMMNAMMAAAQSGDEAAVQAAMGAQMGEMMAAMLWVSVFSTALNVALRAAAVTRRRHHADLSGRWGLMPAGPPVASTGYMTTRIDEFRALAEQMMSMAAPQAAMAAQSQMSNQSLLGWVPIIALVLLGIRKSTEGPNRYAEA